MKIEQFEDFLGSIENFIYEMEILDELIGEIDFELPDELIITIDDNEDFIEEPHFHIHTPDHSFESCVCLYKSEYISHNDKYKDSLSDLELFYIDEYLSKNNNEIWKACVDEWIRVTGQDIPNKYQGKPDYRSELNE